MAIWNAAFSGSKYRSLRLIKAAYVPLFAGMALIFAAGFKLIPNYFVWVGLSVTQLSIGLAFGSVFALKKEIRMFPNN